MEAKRIVDYQLSVCPIKELAQKMNQNGTK